jgi:hypothetical protein
VESGTGGGLSKIELTSTSWAAAVATALGGVPATVSAALESASSADKSLTALRQSGEAERLAALKTRKDLLEAEIAYDDALAGRTASEDLARIRREIELLTARKQLTDLDTVTIQDIEDAGAAPSP